MDVDLSAVALFNSTGGGLLQADPRDLGTIGGLRYAYSSDDTSTMSSESLRNTQGYHPAIPSFDFTSPVVFEDDDSISFKITVDTDNPVDGISAPYNPGKTTEIQINKDVVNTALGRTDGTISTFIDYYQVLRHVLSGSGATSTLYSEYYPPGQYQKTRIVPDKVGIVHTGLDGYDGSSMQITDLNIVGLDITNEIAETDINYGTRRSSMTLDFEPFTVYDGITVSMSFQVDRETPMALSFDKNYVNSVLGVEDGVVATSDDMATLLNSLIDRDDINIEATGGTVSVKTDPLIDRKSGEKSAIGFYNISVSNEPRPTMDFLDIDIKQNPDLVDYYLTYMETVTTNVIDGAATLGSLKQQIDMQTDFASKLMDSIDSGVGQLVDADMEEASARLQALQTQEQLAFQSLQITNSASQNILSLFS
ncbi:MAG TPA: flagellin [Rhizobium sp.]